VRFSGIAIEFIGKREYILYIFGISGKWSFWRKAGFLLWKTAQDPLHIGKSFMFSAGYFQINNGGIFL
jgi:hypothetical protein